MKRKNLKEEFVNTFALLANRIALFNQQDNYDINKECELAFCEILNLIYNINLMNMNDERHNFPAIDLGDEKSKVCYQVTSNTNSKKIKDTKEKFFKNNLNEKYNKLCFLFLTTKYNGNQKKHFEKNVKFCFLDFSDLISEISKKDLEEQQQILIKLKEELDIDNDPFDIYLKTDVTQDEHKKKELLCKLLKKEKRSEKIKQNNDIKLSNSPILCIDFGTSYTLAAVKDINNETHLIPDLTKNTSFPTEICFLCDGEYLIGNNVPCELNNEAFYRVSEIKKLIGKVKKVNITEDLLIDIELVLCMIFKSVILNAEQYLGLDIKTIMLSIPTSFEKYEEGTIKKALKLIDVTLKRIIQEPSLPQIFIHNNCLEDKIVITFDLGGGTLDFSLINIGDDIHHVFVNQR